MMAAAPTIVIGAVTCANLSSSTKLSAHNSSSAFLSTAAQRLRCQTLPFREDNKGSHGALLVSATFNGDSVGRREAINLSGAAFLLASGLSPAENVNAAEFTDMPALRGKDYGKSKMSYPDYVQTESGLQYKDLRDGSGPNPHEGDLVVVDWAGYTIGYYGRIFEARNKAKGGSFEGNEKGYFKFQLGADEVIPAFEEAVKSMRVGGVRR